MKHSRPITAKNLLLDLLRASQGDAWPVRQLVAAAELFGIKENAVRVNITRLVARGILETDSRGFYRMSQRPDPIRDWINTWVDGEQRMRPWDGAWLAVSAPNPCRTQDRKSLDQQLAKLGFRDLDGRFWLRPDNLSLPNNELASLLNAFCDNADLLLSSMNAVFRDGISVDIGALWNPAALEDDYRHMNKRLQDSRRQLERRDIDTILRESFILGGEAIHLLAVDPLLPASMINADLRAELTATMIDYDHHFQRHWLQVFENRSVAIVPIDVHARLAEN